MNRRDFVTAAATAGMAAVPASAAAGSSIFEMRWFRLRNGSQVQRTTDFLSKHFVPAARRAGIGPMGFFSSLIAEQGPFVLALASYPSLQAVLRYRGPHGLRQGVPEGLRRLQRHAPS